MRRKIFILVFTLLSIAAPGQNQDLKLWYRQPANSWNEALPVGNGNLGAMVFGGVTNERLQLNEKSVWAGGKEDFVNPKALGSLKEVRRLLFEGKYAEAQKLAQADLMGDKKFMSSYQTLGDLELIFDNVPVSDYKRELDLNTAVALVSYRSKDVAYKRTVFSSAPDNALVVRLTADKASAISFSLKLSRPGNKAQITYDGGNATLFEHVNDGRGVKAFASLKVIHVGGNVTSSTDGISVSGADEVTILLTAATDFYGGDPLVLAKQRLASASSKLYDALLSDHTKDYQNFFHRVSLSLGESDAKYFPTDQRLDAFREGSEDPQLYVLHFQFGRYLLISSSRPGGLPANLQGLWADGLIPPWDADYHININIQMNYWPAEVANLSELHQPFFDYLKILKDDGKKTAKSMYGMPGAVAHFTSDAWGFTEPYGQTQWAMWPMGYAWCTQHLWQHYLFTSDKKFLETVAYPLLKEAATFSLAWLTKDPRSGKLVSGPSISPENTFRTSNGDVATMVMGPTMDHMIIRELFRSVISASEILGTDKAFAKKVKSALEQLAPTRIGRDGRILEWTEEFEEPEPGHRHISHLYGLFPGNEITKTASPDLFEAASKTIQYRLEHGGGHTGWSRAWIINFYARLFDGDKAHENLRALLEKSTLPNLFDNHPPFQIDGNFGAVSGIVEMLLQSHDNGMAILPALPSEWTEGEVKGLRARGGFEIDIAWSGGRLKQLTIRSLHGKTCVIRSEGLTVTLETTAGKTYTLDGKLQIVQ